MTTTAQDYILVERRQLDEATAIATITINRPRQRNAINYEMWGALADLVQELDRDRAVRVVVFTGAGDTAFSAGADIADFDQYRADSAKGKVYNDAVDRLLDALATMDTPTISMIRGFAAGGGCELAVATDLRIAAQDSRLGIPAARLGISIGHREMRGLVSLVGKGNALYILLSGRLLEADEALRIGLVNQVTAPRGTGSRYLPTGLGNRGPGAPVPRRQQADAEPGAGQAVSGQPDPGRGRRAPGPVRHQGLSGGLPGFPGKARAQLHREVDLIQE